MSERLYHGYTLEQIEKMGGDNEACIAYDMIAHIRELEADLARVTAERDARVELPDMTENSCIGIFGCGEGQGYAADFHDARGVVTLNVKERKSTPTAALEALKAKMEERK